MTTPATTLETLRARVARGAALLDRDCPGWAARISSDRLAIQMCSSCVLGQLYGDYCEGKRALSLWSDPVQYGFNLYQSEWPKFGPQLTPLWLAVIAKRLEPAPSDVSVETLEMVAVG